MEISKNLLEAIQTVHTNSTTTPTRAIFYSTKEPLGISDSDVHKDFQAETEAASRRSIGMPRGTLETEAPRPRLR